jgi:hypothetical protein
MQLLGRDEIVSALERLGQLALAEGESLQAVVLGGAAMVLAYNARPATHDVDVVFLPPPDASVIRQWSRTVAQEFGWPDDWLNDAAKGFLVGFSRGPTLLSFPGIEVFQPAVEQLLAMKLCAWRDDVDIADATRLLEELGPSTNRESAWSKVLPFLLRGRELKAQYAFADLWESTHDHDRPAGRSGPAS